MRACEYRDMTTAQLTKALELLATRNALAAMRGKPCPVACRVVERLERALKCAH